MVVRFVNNLNKHINRMTEICKQLKQTHKQNDSFTVKQEAVSKRHESVVM